MAEYVNDKWTAGRGTQALGIIGTALGGINAVAGNGLLGLGATPPQQYVTKETFDLQTKVTSLESKNTLLEAGMATKDAIAGVRDELIGYVHDLEKQIDTNASNQAVINCSTSNGLTALSGQVNTIQAVVNNITKTAVPSSAICNFGGCSGGCGNV